MADKLKVEKDKKKEKKEAKKEIVKEKITIIEPPEFNIIENSSFWVDTGFFKPVEEMQEEWRKEDLKDILEEEKPKTVEDAVRDAPVEQKEKKQKQDDLYKTTGYDENDAYSSDKKKDENGRRNEFTNLPPPLDRREPRGNFFQLGQASGEDINKGKYELGRDEQEYEL